MSYMVSLGPPQECDHIRGWLGDPNLKALIVERMGKHRAEDEIIQGHFQIFDSETASGYKGCFIGCMLERQSGGGYWSTLSAEDLSLIEEAEAPDEGWHEAVELQFGIPYHIGRLLDRTFEALSRQEAANFAVAVVDAVPVGAVVWDAAVPIILDLLTDPTYGAAVRLPENSDQLALLRSVCNLITEEPLDYPALGRAAKAAHRSTEDWDAFGQMAWAMHVVEVAASTKLAPMLDFLINATPYEERAPMVTWAAGRILHHIAATGEQGRV